MDLVVKGLKSFFRDIFSPVKDFISRFVEGLIQVVVSTPNPNSVFSKPTNGAWPNIYDYYWDSIFPTALLLWALSLGLIILLESTSHLFSSYHRSKLKKRAFSGLVGILSWWWIASLSLRFIDGLADYIVPSLADVSLFDTASFAAIGVLGLVLSFVVDLVLFLALGLIYYGRQVALYFFTLMMPLLIAFWVPGVGPFAVVSRLMRRLAGFYVPFLFMTVPVAVLLRLSKLLGTSASLSMGGFGQWLMAIITPILAIAVPIILFWQAGSLFNAARTTARHASRQNSRARINTVRSASREASNRGRNFVRGVRGRHAVRSDGQAVLGSGDSRSHAAGSRLRETGSSLAGRGPETSTNGGSNSGGESGGGATASRNESFDNLRNRSPNPSSSAYPEDERPYYVN